MKPLLKLSRTVIVEGKYDKIRLQNIIDAVIIQTNGFQIFKDEKKRGLIRAAAEKNGLLILTDSDKAGSIIRSHIKSIAPSADIVNVYLPQISGKEHRKNKPSAEGFLGVEGTPDSIIENALSKFAVKSDFLNSNVKIQKSDFYKLGLSGKSDSTVKRHSLLKYLNLPENLTANALLDALNALYSYNEFYGMVKKWQQDSDKN